MPPRARSTAARGSSPRAPQRRQRRQGAAQAQRGLAAAAHELQCLHDELDFADAAGAELDVALVAFAPALLSNLAMHVAQAGIGVEVEIFSVDEWRDQLLAAPRCDRR